MMDIKELMRLLRALSESPYPSVQQTCMAQAADEIDRLREAMEEILKEVGTSTKTNKIATAALLRVRNWLDVQFNEPFKNGELAEHIGIINDALPTTRAFLLPTPEQIEPILDDFLPFSGPTYPELRRRCAQRIFDLCAVMSGAPITPSGNRVSPVPNGDRGSAA